MGCNSIRKRQSPAHSVILFLTGGVENQTEKGRDRDREISDGIEKPKPFMHGVHDNGQILESYFDPFKLYYHVPTTWWCNPQVWSRILFNYYIFFIICHFEILHHKFKRRKEEKHEIFQEKLLNPLIFRRPDRKINIFFN